MSCLGTCCFCGQELHASDRALPAFKRPIVCIDCRPEFLSAEAESRLRLLSKPKGQDKTIQETARESPPLAAAVKQIPTEALEELLAEAEKAQRYIRKQLQKHGRS